MDDSRFIIGIGTDPDGTKHLLIGLTQQVIEDVVEGPLMPVVNPELLTILGVVDVTLVYGDTVDDIIANVGAPGCVVHPLPARPRKSH